VRVPAEPSTVPPRVADLANVWCTACHGPGRIIPTDDSWERGAKYAVDVCAVCHEGGPVAPTRVAEWRLSRMAHFIRGLAPDDPALQRGCARCHSAQGFIAWQRTGSIATLPDARIVQPITCAACHDAHSPDQPWGLRAWNGAVGSTALCATCHASLASRTDPVARAERRAPHAPQGDLILRAGNAHGRGQDACVQCHMTGDDPSVGRHTFALRDPEGRPNPTACVACHSGATNLDSYLAVGDWDGDGRREPHVEEFDGLMALLHAQIDRRVAALPPAGCGPDRPALVASVRDRVVLADAAGVDLGDCDRDGQLDDGESAALVPDDDLYDAAFIWIEATIDRSRGMHDPRGQIRDLQDAIRLVADGPLPPWDRPAF
jgi:predicted CXXCH cytochrome family protein